MTQVHLFLPCSLLRQFREIAAALIYDGFEPDREAQFHELLQACAAEFMLAHADGAVLNVRPIASGPCMTVYSAVPAGAAEWFGDLARRSGLMPYELWHLAILEFCGREVAPGLERHVVEVKEAA